MLLINFSHPFTDDQRQEVERLCQRAVTIERQVLVHFDHHQPFGPQARSVVEGLNIDAPVIQSEPVVVVLPGYAAIASVVLAELHGRLGHFPTVVRMRPVENSATTVYEIAELINLQQIRDEARTRRAQ